jgi:sigma-54 dependent transcriptional regulator, flagellar regulatory protein
MRIGSCILQIVGPLNANGLHRNATFSVGNFAKCKSPGRKCDADVSDHPRVSGKNPINTSRWIKVCDFFHIGLAFAERNGWIANFHSHGGGPPVISHPVPDRSPSVACSAPPGADAIIGDSQPMRELFALMEKLSRSACTVLISGESGTGKGMVARAIHRGSDRAARPFVGINCGAIPETLLESELFGHVKGAFTGATVHKIGKFEQADGGTVFLDEIGDMSPELQVKLLKVLEEREFEPVGGARTVSVDVRIVAATHKDLEAEVRAGRFREDLFYRLYVIPLRMPALRERPEDIPLLAEFFLDHFNRENRGEVGGLSPEAMVVLRNHAWPGNVRELKNLVERMVVLKGSGKIGLGDLPAFLRAGARIPPASVPCLSDDGLCFNTAVSEFEKALILQSLEKTRWVKKQAADLLRLNRTTLVEKIKRYHLQ